MVKRNRTNLLISPFVGHRAFYCYLVVFLIELIGKKTGVTASGLLITEY